MNLNSGLKFSLTIRFLIKSPNLSPLTVFIPTIYPLMNIALTFHRVQTMNFVLFAHKLFPTSFTYFISLIFVVLFEH